MRPSSTALTLLSIVFDVLASPNRPNAPLSTTATTPANVGQAMQLLAGQVITLNHRSLERTEEEWGIWAKNHRDYLISKYGANPSLSRRNRGTNLIVNQNADSGYYGSLAVGTPPIAFNVILDTGSSDLWIADSSCKSGCQNIPTFDHSKSSTFVNIRKNFTITYGSGQASGMLAEDTFRMAGFSVSNQTFAVCDRISSGLLSSPVSGLLGLAWQSIASSDATPLWQNLVEKNAWNQPVMSFHLSRYGDQAVARTLEPGGQFTMGFVNSSLYTGDIEYQNIPGGKGTYWILSISNLTVQGNPIQLSSGSSSYAAIDTGTTLVGGPPDEVARIYAQIPDAQRGTGNYEGYFMYPCSTKVDITMSFGGSSWPINSSDFRLTQLPSTDKCLGAFFEINMSGSAPSWIVGDTFLKNVYAVFRYDPPSIGFASLSAYALSQNGVLNAQVPSPTIGSGPETTVTATGRGGNRSSSDAEARHTPLMLSTTFSAGALVISIVSGVVYVGL